MSDPDARHFTALYDEYHRRVYAYAVAGPAASSPLSWARRARGSRRARNVRPGRIRARRCRRRGHLAHGCGECRQGARDRPLLAGGDDQRERERGRDFGPGSRSRPAR
ncbi:MAG: hypothetical protein ACM3ML_23630 [Micromonosporaceae bacterium]